jgi:hypothetical protein
MWETLDGMVGLCSTDRCKLGSDIAVILSPAYSVTIIITTPLSTLKVQAFSLADSRLVMATTAHLPREIFDLPTS